jgi:hypothetical protein
MRMLSSLSALRAGLPLDWARVVPEAALTEQAADTIAEG